MADNEKIPVREKGESNEDYIERLKGELFQKPKEKNAAFNARVRNIVAKQKAEEAELEAKKKEAFDKMIAEAIHLFKIAPPGAEGNVVRNAAVAALKATGFNKATDYEDHAAIIKRRREFAAAEEARRLAEAKERNRAASEAAAEEKAAYAELVKLYGSSISADIAIRTYGSIWTWPRSLTELYRGLITRRKEELANPMTPERRAAMERAMQEEDDRRAARRAARKAAERAAASGASAAQGGPAPPRHGPSPPRAAPPPNKNAWKYKQSTNWTRRVLLLPPAHLLTAAYASALRFLAFAI